MKKAWAKSVFIFLPSFKNMRGRYNRPKKEIIYRFSAVSFRHQTDLWRRAGKHGAMGCLSHFCILFKAGKSTVYKNQDILRFL